MAHQRHHHLHLHLLLLLLLRVLTLSPFFLQLSKLVAAENNNLIEMVCHVAEVPESCIQCLKSDPHSEIADEVGIAIILMNCLTDHIDALENNMSKIAAVSKDKSTVKLFQNCSKDYATARKYLNSAITSLKSGKYDAAETSVTLALKFDTDCHFKIVSFKKKISHKIAFEIKLFEDLCQAANRIIERL